MSSAQGCAEVVQPLLALRKFTISCWSSSVRLALAPVPVCSSVLCSFSRGYPSGTDSSALPWREALPDTLCLATQNIRSDKVARWENKVWRGL